MVGFLDFLGGVGKWLGSSTGGVNNALALAGQIGGLYSGLQQQKMAKKQFNLQKDAYNFNKMLSQRQFQRQDETDENLRKGWLKSTYATA